MERLRAGTGVGPDVRLLLAFVVVAEGAVGAQALLAPALFAGPAYAPIAPYLPPVGVLLLIAGAVAAAAAGGRVPRAIPAVLAASAVPALVLAVTFARSGTITGVIAWGTVAATLLVVAVGSAAGRPIGGRPLPNMIGFLLLVEGLAMLATPSSFPASLYGSFADLLWLWGPVFAVAGAGLLVGEARGWQRSVIAFIALAVLAVQALVVALLATGLWTGVAFYLALALFLVLGTPRRVEARQVPALLLFGVTSLAVYLLGAAVLGVHGREPRQEWASDVLTHVGSVAVAGAWLLGQYRPRFSGRARSALAAVGVIAGAAAMIAARGAAVAGAADRSGAYGGTAAPGLLVAGFGILLLGELRWPKSVWLSVVHICGATLGVTLTLANLLAEMVNASASAPYVLASGIAGHEALAFFGLSLAVGSVGVIRVIEGPIRGRIFAAFGALVIIAQVRESVADLALDRLQALGGPGLTAPETATRAMLLVLSTAATLGAALLLGTTITAPLAVLLAGVRRYAVGDRSERIGLVPNDEIGIVAAVMDELAENVESAEAASRRSLAAVREERLRLSSILEAQADLHEVALLVRGDQIVYASAALAELTGREPREIGGLRNMLKLIVPEDRAAALARWHAARSSPQRFQTRLRRPDGAVRTLEVALAPADGSAGAGERPSVVALARDVTDRVTAEDRFARVFRSNPTGLALSRLDDGVIVDANDRIAALLGGERDAFIGRTAVGLGLYADPAERDRLLDELRLKGSVRDRDIAMRTRSGDPLHTLVSMERIEIGGTPYVLVALVDISDRRRMEAELEHRALHDSLTGLPNRALFRDRLEQAVAAAGRAPAAFAVLYLDLDDFKEVNDAYGHAVGDGLLRGVGERLGGALREPDTIARFGGDEFALLLGGVRDSQAAVAAARRIFDPLKAPLIVGDRQFYVSVSIGIVLWPGDGASAEELLRHADVAMYAAKRAGGGYARYAPEQDSQSEARLRLRSDLHHALERQELFLDFQPIVDLRGGTGMRAEALVRWRHPERGVVPVGDFIGLAEESGFIRELGLWVIEEALRRCAEFRAGGQGLEVGVNLSSRNLLDPALLPRVESLLARYGVRPEALTVEITESVVMADPERSLAALLALRELGVRLAVDDFGTGYSSLAYLQRLPVSEVKVDRSFVARMTTDPNSAAIVRSTIELGHSLGLEVVAEGVEDSETLTHLRELGCDLAQGYLIARPMSHDALGEWLRARG